MTCGFNSNLDMQTVLDDGAPDGVRHVVGLYIRQRIDHLLYCDELNQEERYNCTYCIIVMHNCAV